MTVIAIPKPLREKLGETATNSLVELFDKIDANSTSRILETAENKFERRLSEEIGNLRADIIRWMFIFWIGQAVTVIGFMSILLPR